jgi:hypothetical protein
VPNANHLATAVQAAGKINVGVLRRREARFFAPVSRSRNDVANPANDGTV